MRTLHLFLFVLATTTLFAQTTTTDAINCDTFPIQFGRVDAPKIPLSFAFVEAIDTRLPGEERMYIETAFDRKCGVFNDVHKTLLTAFSPYWKTANIQSDSIAVALRSFYFTNSSGENGHQYTRVHGIFDFYKIENGNYYQIYSGKVNHFAHCRYTLTEFKTFMSRQLNRIALDFTAFYHSYTFQAENIQAGLKTEALNYAILNTNNIQQGIYISHADFVNNAPSIPFDGVDFAGDETKKEVLAIIKFTAKHEVTTKNGKFNSNIWGFAINNQVYINNGNYTRDHHFSRLDSISYYTHFTGRKPTGGMAASIITEGIAIHKDTPMVLDIETGKFSFLSLYGMSKLLKEDKDLIKALRAERKRNKMEVKKRYIQQANERQLARLKEREDLE